MKTPDDRSLRLVRRIAEALAEFHGEKPGNLGMHIMAAKLLIEWEQLQGYEVSDFLTFVEYKPQLQTSEKLP